MLTSDNNHDKKRELTIAHNIVSSPDHTIYHCRIPIFASQRELLGLRVTDFVLLEGLVLIRRVLVMLCEHGQLILAWELHTPWRRSHHKFTVNVDEYEQNMKRPWADLTFQLGHLRCSERTGLVTALMSTS